MSRRTGGPTLAEFAVVLVILLLIGLLSGCGGGGDDASESRPQLVVIGNSITRHPPLASVGWSGDWGMAVAKPESDFAHLTAAALGADLVEQVGVPASIELGQGDTAGDIAKITAPIGAETIVVVELGDNAISDPPGFLVRYGQMLDAAKHAGVLVCTSTWWRKVPGLDDSMRAQCTARGGRWVDIGDLWRSPENTDPVGLYPNPDVDMHPHEWGMSQIARRIVGAL